MRLGALHGNDRVGSSRSRGTACLAELLGLVVLAALLAGPSTGAAQDYVIPLFTPAGDVQEGFARITNHSDRAGTVRITGTDDTGRSHGPVTLSLSARQTRHFNSGDLEEGNTSKGLSGRLGDGAGNWRLRLQSDLDLEVGAYIRTADGFLSSVHDVVGRAEVGGETVHLVPIFNPASNRNQVSRLRLVNLSQGRVDVRIRGRDDTGRSAPGGEVELTLPARGARQVSAQELEAGDAGFNGRLGDGEGKWQLFVSADGDIEVVSLMSTPTGHLTNLSVSGLGDGGTPEVTSPPPVGSTFRDCTGCPEMVVVPAGSYSMGSLANDPFRGPDESPAHRVTIGEPFAVGVHEVTFAQWDACYRAGGCSHRADDQGWGRGTRPVVDVSWNDAQEYARWLSGETRRSYRLPSEAEWEYVARAGTTTLFWWGDDLDHNRANCDRCGSAWDDRQTAPVGSFSANAFGLHDVHGNVWERVQDCRNDDYVGAPSDASAWEAGNCDWRGVRGGGWKSIPLVMRAANRAWVRPPGSRLFDAETGFRVVRSLAAPARHTLALFRPDGQSQQGFARVINRSNRAGTVRIWGTDDAGNRRGPVSLRLNAEATRHFNSEDLEGGNAAKGLSGRLGNGQGDWRLELESELELEPSAYIRTPDGFLTAMHAVARSAEAGGETVHRVPIFNPGKNRNQVSWLRVANLGDTSTRVTIRGRDDAGRSAPSGEVRLTLPAHGARRLSAQTLESGTAGLSGRLGTGTGKWQLAVTADGAIEVVSLLASPTGHLSNLSTTPGGAVEASGFEIVAEGSTTVRPLQTIALSVPAGLGESDYTVLMDLSGAGAFAADDTLEVEGLTTSDDRVLFASPLTQMLSEANASHRLAVRLRRESDRALSDALRFSIDDITLASEPAGFSTTLLEVLMKSLYTSADDALLQLAGASMQPGAAVLSARRLGLDTTFSDIQAKAILQYLFGMPVTELVSPPFDLASAAISEVGHPKLAQVQSSESKQVCRAVEAAAIEVGACDAVAEVRRCTDTHLSESWHVDNIDEWSLCAGNAFKENIRLDKVPGDLLLSLTGGKLVKLFDKGAGLLLRKLTGKWGDDAAQIYTDVSAGMDAATNEAKMARALVDTEEPGSGDSNRDFDGSGRLTEQGLESNYESLRTISQFRVQEGTELIREAVSDIAGRNLDDEERGAFATFVDEADRRRREAGNIDALEGVYNRQEKPNEAIGNDPSSGVAVGKNCEPGYEEFPIDDETSTCVFQSLVERNCLAGSRPVSVPGVDACLYYSLDFFQPSGTCRTNYARVYFQGRWTCRWDELEPNEPAWYTLHKEEEDDQLPDMGDAAHCVVPDTRVSGPVSGSGFHLCRDLPQGTGYSAYVRNSCSVNVLFTAIATWINFDGRAARGGWGSLLRPGNSQIVAAFCGLSAPAYEISAWQTSCVSVLSCIDDLPSGFQWGRID